MDSLYFYGAKSIQLLQDLAPNSEKYFLKVSEITDPAYAFSVIFPLASIFSTSLGADVLTVSVVSEWANTLLKWLLMEHRPYWWVQEAEGRPQLQQTKLTCETGPGSPSGHCMGATVVGFVIIRWLCKQINEETLIGRVYKRKLNKILWASFLFLLINVTLTRLFIAAHFPHQCILGIICGLIVNYLFSNDCSKVTHWWQNSGRIQLFIAAFVMVAISVSAYWLQQLMGVDPHWSIHLAFKWCSSPDNVHVNTTPLFSLVRDIGAAFGIALTSPISKRGRHYFNKGISAILTFMVCSAMQLATKEIPTMDFRVYYSCIFMLSAMQPYFVLVVIPTVSYVITKFKRD